MIRINAFLTGTSRCSRFLGSLCALGSRYLAVVLGLTLLLLVQVSAVSMGRGEDESETITLYSGRGESLVAPLIQRFEEETGISVRTRYAGTSELAVLLQEEGDRSPADLFWAQDAGALGALAQRELFQSVPEDLIESLPDIYHTDGGSWVATSGRARVLAYHPELIDEDALPRSVFDLTREKYAGLAGWAPTNGSFQSFVTAMRTVHGDEATLRWLREMRENGVRAYRNNTAIVEALAAQEIALGITNNYYLLRFLADDPTFPVRQRFFTDGDTGNLVNVAGIGILKSATNPDGARELLRFLLDTEAQQYFTSTVFEYPVIDSVTRNPRLEQFNRLLEVSPRIDLNALEDLDGTLDLLRRAGAL